MGGGPPGFLQGFSCLEVLWILLASRKFRLRGFHPLRLIFPISFCYLLNCRLQSATPTDLGQPVWPSSISLAATLDIDVSFSSCGYLDVSVHRVPPAWLCIHHAVTEVRSAGFPHSDIHGSLVICTYPWLFAAYHVLRRLLVPRHPPYALLRLISSKCSSSFLELHS